MSSLQGQTPLLCREVKAVQPGKCSLSCIHYICSASHIAAGWCNDCIIIYGVGASTLSLDVCIICCKIVFVELSYVCMYMLSCMYVSGTQKYLGCTCKMNVLP